MRDANNPLGNIYVSYKAIAAVASYSALASYGVVGLAAENVFEALSYAITRKPTVGVRIQRENEKINLDLYVIVEYGTRIKTVTDSAAHAVRFNVEKALGIPIGDVNVHVRGLRVSDPD
ncbi:MAG TPA: Asp23/Gls24 family envelope stress response protein [Anaerolineaceae bacterium]|nr:Asp23/Gls24 family envelope stress response protein [Anaerolineaceae bacterium]HPN52518.1 Asp23/Gls24 family envelope stress response protein [Anaerolineaceae bacterium]